MRKTFLITLVCLLLIVGIAAGFSYPSICDPEDPEELVPTITRVTLQGVCIGSVTLNQDHTFTSVGNDSSQQAEAFKIHAARGAVAISTDNLVTTTGNSVLVDGVKLVDYTGTTAYVRDSFYVSRTARGIENETAPVAPYCETAAGGTELIIGSGTYGSSISVFNSPALGLDLTYDFANGPPGTIPPPAMRGSVHTSLETSQIYGTLTNGTATATEHQATALTSSWTGISLVSGHYEFSTLEG